MVLIFNLIQESVCYNLSRSQEFFSVKSQILNTLGLAGYVDSVSPTQLFSFASLVDAKPA
jgi:hypothetical protein